MESMHEKVHEVYQDMATKYMRLTLEQPSGTSRINEGKDAATETEATLTPGKTDQRRSLGAPTSSSQKTRSSPRQKYGANPNYSEDSNQQLRDWYKVNQSAK